MKLKMLIRAHEVQEEGFKLYKWNYPEEILPLMATVFSASNYCGVYQNRGAVLSVDRTTFNIVGYSEADLFHPFFLMHEEVEVGVFEEGFQHIGTAVLDLFEALLNKAVTVGAEEIAMIPKKKKQERDTNQFEGCLLEGLDLEASSSDFDAGDGVAVF